MSVITVIGWLSEGIAQGEVLRGPGGTVDIVDSADLPDAARAIEGMFARLGVRYRFVAAAWGRHEAAGLDRLLPAYVVGPQFETDLARAERGDEEPSTYTVVGYFRASEESFVGIERTHSPELAMLAAAHRLDAVRHAVVLCALDGTVEIGLTAENRAPSW
jgi:hypothetical protein